MLLSMNAFSQKKFDPNSDHENFFRIGAKAGVNINKITGQSYKEGFNYMFENKSNKLGKGFHVDLPMYYSTTKKSPDLAHLKKL